MTGADEAQRNLANRQTSRTLPFPDGLVRHITLRHWQWKVIDWLHDEAGWPQHAVPQHAYEGALTFWFLDTFNDAAGARVYRPEVEFRFNADEITTPGKASRERLRFENQLRQCLESVVRVNMNRCAGLDHAASNDEFPP